MSSQLIPLALPQDQDKATSQNKCDASYHQNTFISIVNEERAHSVYTERKNRARKRIEEERRKKEEEEE
jgi:hypothetical protein